MEASAGKKKIPIAGGRMVAIIGILVILTIAVIAFFFIRYQQGGGLHADASQSQVIITQPQYGSKVQAGHPIEVRVAAEGLSPVTSVELWINGVLEGVQALPPAGLTSITAFFSWIPKETGNFSLIARAVNELSETFPSDAVIVFVTPQPEVSGQPEAEESGVQPAVFPAPAGGAAGAPPSPPSGLEIEEAEPWQGTPSDWLNSMTNVTLPANPELSANVVDSCTVKLSIHDLSDNEEGFSVFRQTTDHPVWVHVTDLASHAGQDSWFAYTETGVAGGITYYIAAFNSHGDASSNLAKVNIDPQACPYNHPAFEAPVLRVKVKNLTLGEGAGSLYCYNSIDSSLWKRWPQAGFITESLDGAGLDLIEPLVLSDLATPGSGPTAGSMDLKLECWGWQAGALRFLGSLREQIDLKSPKAIPVALTGMSFDILPEITGLEKELFLLGAGYWSPKLVYDPYSIEKYGIPTTDQMPEITAWFTYDHEECLKYRGDAALEAACNPSPGFNQGPGGANPQPFLVWSMNEASCTHPPNPGCYPLSWWQGFEQKYSITEVDPITWVFWVRTFIDGVDHGANGWSIPLMWRIYPIEEDWPPHGNILCNNGYEYISVSLYVQTSVGDFMSQRSNEVAIPCPHKMNENEVTIEVNFNQFLITDIDDGWDDDVAEAYGFFYVYPNEWLPGMGREWGFFDGGGKPYAPPEDYHMTTAGVYNMWELFLAPADFTTEVTGPYQQNNNRVRVAMHEGDAMMIAARLYDYDDFYDDMLCDQSIWIGPYTGREWLGMKDTPINMVTDGDGDAVCNFAVILSAVEGAP